MMLFICLSLSLFLPTAVKVLLNVRLLRCDLQGVGMYCIYKKNYIDAHDFLRANIDDRVCFLFLIKKSIFLASCARGFLGSGWREHCTHMKYNLFMYYSSWLNLAFYSDKSKSRLLCSLANRCHQVDNFSAVLASLRGHNTPKIICTLTFTKF